jgi:cellulose synthase/poly-beta-1,6-N-acetylglucosamine synthase-like glycosyltransferase
LINRVLTLALGGMLLLALPSLFPMTALALFWGSVLFIFYADVGYWLLLKLWPKKQRASVQTPNSDLPTISLLICARNEEAVLGEKLRATLLLDYPKEKREIWVISDGSEDSTDSIAKEFAVQGVKLSRVDDGLGKTNAIDRTLPLTSGEVIIISDANSEYATDALRHLVAPFSEASIGVTTGTEKRVSLENGQGAGEGIYARLDNNIKSLVSDACNLTMINGGFVAFRRILWPADPPYVCYDASLPGYALLKGYRSVYTPRALSTEVYPLDEKQDFSRRVRTVLQAYQSYLYRPSTLAPTKTGWYGFHVFSHRFSRWFVFPFQVLALGANALLALTSPIYSVLFALHLGLYILACVGLLRLQRGKRGGIAYIAYYFVYIHLAVFCGVIDAWTGRKIARWKPEGRVLPTQKETL